MNAASNIEPHRPNDAGHRSRYGTMGTIRYSAHMQTQEERMEHITTLTMRLNPPEGTTFTPGQAADLGPKLQGVMMETIDSAYAEYLHASAFNPYSQHCRLNPDGSIAWKISALTDSAAKQIIAPLVALERFELRSIQSEFTVGENAIQVMGIDSLLKEINAEGDSKQRIRFVTPTAFKSQGEYVMMPTPRLIFQNLFMHYAQTYSGVGESDQETIDYMSKHIKISAYNLRSRYFSHSSNTRAKIPAFIGEATLSISGPQPMQGLARMLLKFGDYAGVGIKTSMGMGGFERIP